MKPAFYPSFLLPLLTFLSTANAEWEQRPVGFVWTGQEKPAKIQGMLKGTIYDIKRDRFGRLKPEVSAHIGNWWEYVKDDYMDTILDLMNRRVNDLKNNYVYDTPVAAAHFYLNRKYGVSMDNALKVNASGDIITDSSSDIISAEPIELKGGWIGIFRGKVTAPRSMKFRFVGTADDTLIVRFNGKVVLETGYVIPSSFKGNNGDETFSKGKDRHYQQAIRTGTEPKHRGYSLIALKSTPFINSELGGLVGGTPISVTEGNSYPIEVIIGECGRHAFYYLMTQQIRGSGKTAPLEIFRTNDTWPIKHQQGSENGPSFSDSSPIWHIVEKKKK